MTHIYTPQEVHRATSPSRNGQLMFMLTCENINMGTYVGSFFVTVTGVDHDSGWPSRENKRLWGILGIRITSAVAQICMHISGIWQE